MKFLVLEVFDRENLDRYNPWCLYYEITKSRYNHQINYSFEYTNILFSISHLKFIRRKMIK